MHISKSQRISEFDHLLLELLPILAPTPILEDVSKYKKDILS